MFPLDLLRLNSTIFKLMGVELDYVGLTFVEIDPFGLPRGEPNSLWIR